MNALQHLPAAAKDLILPTVLLRGWVSANEFQSTLDKIEDVYSARPTLVDIDPYIDDIEITRDVHTSLIGLKNPHRGFRAWCDLIADIEHFIPCLQLGPKAEIEKQIDTYQILQREYCFRVEEKHVRSFLSISEYQKSQEYPPTIINIDVGQQSADILQSVARTLSYLDEFRQRLPNPVFCVTSTTFPSSFDGMDGQSIYERLFFEQLQEVRPDLRLVFGDRGSARAEKLGGGGVPVPRIDLAAPDRWRFFRERVEEHGSKEAAYAAAARRAMQAPEWDGTVNIWGTEMIQRTASHAPNGINSPVKTTATRIHLHLYKQAFFGRSLPDQLDLDEKWDEAI